VVISRFFILTELFELREVAERIFWIEEHLREAEFRSGLVESDRLKYAADSAAGKDRVWRSICFKGYTTIGSIRFRNLLFIVLIRSRRTTAI